MDMQSLYDKYYSPRKLLKETIVIYYGPSHNHISPIIFHSTEVRADIVRRMGTINRRLIKYNVLNIKSGPLRIRF